MRIFHQNLIAVLALLIGGIQVCDADEVEILKRPWQQRSSEPLCGLYSLVAAARSIDADVDLGTLFDEKYVSSAKGSSIRDLIDAARSMDLYARPMQGLTVSSLKAADAPFILHLNRSRHQTTSRHWVCFLGDRDGEARIFDSGSGISLVSYADLLAEWDGVGVRVAKTGARPLIVSRIRGFILPFFVFAGIGGVALFKTIVPHRWVVPSLIRQVSLVGLTTAGLALAFHSLSDTGLIRNPSSVALVSQYHFALSLPEISTQELREAVVLKEDIVIVDARNSEAFRAGHIPGAINLPVDSSPSQLADAVAVLAERKLIVVYCQSRSCRWDEQVARHLVFSGLDGISLYPGGWQEWSEYDNDGK